jgi:hypothetical protein
MRVSIPVSTQCVETRVLEHISALLQSVVSPIAILRQLASFQNEPGPSYEAGDSTCSAHDFPLEG